MHDLILANGDLAYSGADLMVTDDKQDYLLKSLTTPRGYLSQLIYEGSGQLSDVDTTYGNAIFGMLAENFNPSLYTNMRQAIIDASYGSATDVTLTVTDTATVRVDLQTDEGLLQFTL